MPVWKLTPTDLAHPAWAESRRRGPAIVRAASEGAARRITAAAFQTSTEPLAETPWTDPSLVAIQELEDPRFDPKGRSEVLDPAG
jgi:hypothetical protein